MIRDRTAQKAVVCLYLRYRRARRYAHAIRQQFPPNDWLSLTANARGAGTARTHSRTAEAVAEATPAT